MAEMQNVPPLLYSQVRMLAEAALGIRNDESATFTFDPTNTNGPLVVDPDRSAPRGVTVPATNATKFTDPGHVLLQVETPVGPATLNAVDYHADAVFWSAAAVQKFVLPYYASCMGYGAAASLTALEQAWNGEIQGVRVFALMHVPAAPPSLAGAEIPVEPLWVVFLEGNHVRALPLADFAGRNPASLPVQQTPAPVPYTAPSPDQIPHPYPDYTALRSMAEWAAALDARPMYFTYDPHARQFGEPAPQAGTGGGKIVVPVFNPFVRGDRLTPTRVMFGSLDVGPYCDAAFWSTGAIEQFLLPYYASLDGFAGLGDVQALREAWTENRAFVGGNILEDGREVHVLGPEEEGTLVVGILHIWPSMLVTDESSNPSALRREITALHAPRGEGRRWGVRERAERAASAA